MWGRRWRSSGGSPRPPPPRSPPPTSHPPLRGARRFSPGNLGALLPPDSGSTGSKVPDTGHSRNSPAHELLPTGLCTVHNHGLRIISTQSKTLDISNLSRHKRWPISHIVYLFDSLSSSLMPLQSPFCFSAAAASPRDANWCTALPSTNCRETFPPLIKTSPDCSNV